MTEPARHLHLVDHNGEAEQVCANCVELERDLRALRRRRTQLENELAAAERQAQAPSDPDIEEVLTVWFDLAVESRWFKLPPQCGPASTRWKDTGRALVGTKKKGVWEWVPRSVSELTYATRGAFIRAEAQRYDRNFKRDYLDPCTAFFSNFARNYETATDPAPGRDDWIRPVFEAPKPLRERWVEVLSQADPCDCGHLRFDHHKQGDGKWACGVHGCYCIDFCDTDVKAEQWWNERLTELRRKPARCDICKRPVTAEQFAAYEASCVGGVYDHLRCFNELMDRHRGPDGIVRAG